MAYEEHSIPAILKEWEPSFVERFRMFTNEKERNRTLASLLKNQDPDKNNKTHPVTLKIFVRSDKDQEALRLDGFE